ncbi:MAG: hypothetical protein LUF92_14890 [Clostridiales bacterium]|nr:hypothetical protein [Clostridiales bacterium]
MIIVFDITFLLIIVLILGAGSVAAAASWVLNHLAIVFIVLMLKSLLLVGKAVLCKGKPVSYYIGATLFLLLDVARTGYALWAIVQLLENMMGGDIFQFAGGLIVLILVGALVVFFAETPMYLFYNEFFDDLTGGIGLCIIMQIVAIGCIFLIMNFFSWILFIIMAIVVYGIAMFFSWL